MQPHSLIFENDFDALESRAWREIRTETQTVETEREKERETDRVSRGGGEGEEEDVAPVKLPSTGYSITRGDEPTRARGAEGPSVESGWVMHECEGLWAIWVYLRLTGKSLVWRLTEGGSKVSARRHFCEARRVKSSRILTKKTPRNISAGY